MNDFINPVEDTRPIHLYFDRDPTDLKITPEVDRIIQNLSHRVYMCKCWSDLPEFLKLKPASICFDQKELNYSTAVDIVNMVKTMSKLVNVKDDIPIAINVGNNFSLQTLKVVQRSGIHGIIPRACDFTVDECLKGCNALWSKIPYWPKHIIDQLPGNKKKTQKQNNVKLTPRQEQVLQLIQERGASNKVIANLLKISESTVKLHVASIFKKYNVRNRTQLALFGKK